MHAGVAQTGQSDSFVRNMSRVQIPPPALSTGLPPAFRWRSWFPPITDPSGRRIGVQVPGAAVQEITTKRGQIGGRGKNRPCPTVVLRGPALGGKTITRRAHLQPVVPGDTPRTIHIPNYEYRSEFDVTAVFLKRVCLCKVPHALRGPEVSAVPEPSHPSLLSLMYQKSEEYARGNREHR